VGFTSDLQRRILNVGNKTIAGFTAQYDKRDTAEQWIKESKPDSIEKAASSAVGSR
jgi:predicted GIY-YIG superfamily endonuclease